MQKNEAMELLELAGRLWPTMATKDPEEVALWIERLSRSQKYPSLEVAVVALKELKATEEKPFPPTLGKFWRMLEFVTERSSSSKQPSRMSPAEALDWFHSLDLGDQQQARRIYRRMYSSSEEIDLEQQIAYEAAHHPRYFGLPDFEEDRRDREELHKMLQNTIRTLKAT